MRWTLDEFEVDLVRTLVTSLADVLEGRDPRDAAVQRLFPATVVGDDEADAELRGLIHDDLAGVKRAGLTALGGLLDGATRKGSLLRVELTPDDTLLVLGVLNDLRLAIGARIAIEDLDRDDVDPDSALGYRLAVMDHLGLWQELLLAIVDPPAVRIHDLDVEVPDDPRDA
ncbi:DUF2017 family protein [Nitriliruptor alkaliphilus]|uniref:DUF2017 family protein n=1 Tax=Nitriliruptor alkaliphilus TaxID=427918 RepID=UPI0006970B04|nr:DUF2017 family protein [Nitriliruptor alkaliphilus]